MAINVENLRLRNEQKLVNFQEENIIFLNFGILFKTFNVKQNRRLDVIQAIKLVKNEIQKIQLGPVHGAQCEDDNKFSDS